MNLKAEHNEDLKRIQLQAEIELGEVYATPYLSLSCLHLL